MERKKVRSYLAGKLDEFMSCPANWQKASNFAEAEQLFKEWLWGTSGRGAAVDPRIGE